MEYMNRKSRKQRWQRLVYSSSSPSPTTITTLRIHSGVPTHQQIGGVIIVKAMAAIFIILLLLLGTLTVSCSTFSIVAAD